MTKIQLFALSMLIVVGSIGCSSATRHSGTYEGTCHNYTVNADAKLLITLISARDGVVSGNIAITGELEGSSPITGLIEGDVITFTSKDATASYTITWRGRISGKKIEGTYVVSERLLEKQLGAVDQEGKWSVSKME